MPFDEVNSAVTATTVAATHLALSSHRTACVTVVARLTERYTKSIGSGRVESRDCSSKFRLQSTWSIDVSYSPKSKLSGVLGHVILYCPKFPNSEIVLAVCSLLLEGKEDDETVWMIRVSQVRL